MTHIGSYGQGIGGPVQITDDPNAPTFDAAEATGRDSRIAALLKSGCVSDWETTFLLSVYGTDRMSPKQRKIFIRICAAVKERIEAGVV